MLFSDYSGFHRLHSRVFLLKPHLGVQIIHFRPKQVDNHLHILVAHDATYIVAKGIGTDVQNPHQTVTFSDARGHLDLIFRP